MRELLRGIRLLQPEDYRRMPWKNGLGMTTEIAVSPMDAGFDGQSFDWRVSIADVEKDCEFSLFPGHDRSIVLIDGAGMELGFDSVSPHRINQLHVPFKFKGEYQTWCRLLDGPVHDFNVMSRREKFKHTCEVLASPSTIHWKPDTEILLIYCLESRLSLEGFQDMKVEISKGRTLILDKRTDIPADNVLKISTVSKDMVAVIVCISDK